MHGILWEDRIDFVDALEPGGNGNKKDQVSKEQRWRIGNRDDKNNGGDVKTVHWKLPEQQERHYWRFLVVRNTEAEPALFCKYIWLAVVGLGHKVSH